MLPASTRAVNYLLGKRNLLPQMMRKEVCEFERAVEKHERDRYKVCAQDEERRADRAREFHRAEALGGAFLLGCGVEWVDDVESFVEVVGDVSGHGGLLSGVWLVELV